MRTKFAKAIYAWKRRWQGKNEDEKLALIVQYLTVLTMILGLFHFLH
jgi:hypothetical protein